MATVATSVEDGGFNAALDFGNAFLDESVALCNLASLAHVDLDDFFK